MDFPLPPVGEGLFEVELVRWLVKPGTAVARGQSLMEVMSDKATMEVPSPFAGTIRTTMAEEGTKVKVGQVVLAYDGAGSPVPATIAMPKAHAAAAVLAAPRTNVAAAPSVRHLARKLGVDLAKVAGSGPAGRVLLEDLAAFIRPSAKPAKDAAGPKLDVGVAGSTFRMVGVRRKIAEKMVASKRGIPHYAYVDECDFSELVRLRTQLKEPFAAVGVKLTYLAFVVKAVARALREVPLVNATYNEATETVTLYDRYHIGIAVAAPAGLIVPVLRDADTKDIAGIAREIERLSGEARAGKAKLDDLRGGTFTLTSVGSIGGLISTPIINHPEVGIMGLGKIVKRPVYDEAGQIRPADMAYLSFSFDHRIVDGAIGATFGNAVVRLLQAPAQLLLEWKA